MLISLTERKSRLALLARGASKTAEAVREASLCLLEAFVADNVHTLIADNGNEFA